MPKVYLTKDDKLDEDFRRLIRVGMARQGIDTQKELARKMRCSDETMSYRLRNPDSFSRRELRHICKILKIAPEELAEVI